MDGCRDDMSGIIVCAVRVKGQEDSTILCDKIVQEDGTAAIPFC